jgi:hypothetical protein
MVGSGSTGLNGSYVLSNPLSASVNKTLTGLANYTNNATAALGVAMVAGQYKSNTAVNAFRVLASSGNIASGTVRCYGIAH